ncbi:MAG TPA: YdcF family protein [Gammaproteobacteria bacterium]|nr:YdcF family protein [Gammaproteobacteria bacterium]
MEILITRSIENLIFPPGSIIVLIVLGLLVVNRHKRAASTLFALAGLGLYALSIPVTGQLLLRSLETSYPALTPQDLQPGRAQAIVVLGAGRYPKAPEYGGDTLADAGLERVRYGAYLHKLTGLPIIVTGGDPLKQGSSEASIMRRVLLDDYQISQVWTEDDSRTTGENALFTKTLLDKHGIKHVYLITQAWHMPRAVRIFQKAGVQVVPAPTRFLTARSRKDMDILDWLPNAGALRDSMMALHELLGSVWYRIRY